jgi:glycosyltransferase involved in cell wall biosynthesis
MKVSVIIPLFNKARYIQRAIDSVLAQTYIDYELIVVDDGSTDDGVKIVRKYSDMRIRLILQDNAGPGAARNRGIKESFGKYIAFLDADDEWLPLFLEKTTEYLDLHSNVATISTGYLDMGRPLGIIEKLWDKKGVIDGHYRVWENEYSAQFVSWLLSYMNPWSTVSRKTVLLQYGGFFDKWKCLYAEDSYLWLQVLLSETVAVIREPHVVYHSEASELSQNRTTPYPIAPYHHEPAPLYESCSINSRKLLEQILSIKAVESSINHSMNGFGRESRMLLSRFSRKYRPQEFRKAKLFSLIAPILPTLRSLRRIVKQKMRKIP